MQLHRLLTSIVVCPQLTSCVFLLCLHLSNQVRPSETSDDVGGKVSRENAQLTVSSGGHILHARNGSQTNVSQQHSREPANGHRSHAHESGGLQKQQKPKSKAADIDTAIEDSLLPILSMPVGLIIGSALIGICAAEVFEQWHVNMDKGTRDFHALYIFNLTTWFLFAASVTIVIPESAYLAESMGHDPVDSGYLIGCIFFLSGPYMLFLKPYVDPWPQEFMSRVARLMVFGNALSAAIYAVGADPPTNSWDGSMRFALCIIARTILPGSDGGGMVLLMMQMRVTPTEETVAFIVIQNSLKIVGYGSGVLMSALATQFLTPTDVGGRAAYPLWLLATLIWINFVFGCFLVPSDLTAAEQRKNEIDMASLERRVSTGSTDLDAAQRDSKCSDARSLPPQSLQSAAFVLPEAVKRQIWTMGVLIGAQRALVVSSVESATTFILEKEFGRTASDAGVMVCLSLWVGVPLYFIKNYLQVSSWPVEVWWFRLSGGVAVVASLSFVKSVGQVVAPLLHLEASHIILLGDAILYPAAYLASSIMDGLVGTIAMPGTSYNMDNYFLLDTLLQNSFARGLAPVYARYMLHHYGRNSYAWAQFGNLAISLISNIICVPLYLPAQEAATGPASSSNARYS